MIKNKLKTFLNFIYENKSEIKSIIRLIHFFIQLFL